MEGARVGLIASALEFGLMDEGVGLSVEQRVRVTRLVLGELRAREGGLPAVDAGTQQDTQAAVAAEGGRA